MSAPAEQPHRHPAPPALVGRKRERATLRDALAAALAGRGSLVLIGGEAGIGKTALGEVLLAEAGVRGATVLVGRCYDLAETPPYGPWAEALDRAPRGEALPPVPDFGGGGAANQAALFAAVRDYLAALATARPVVLLLDDLHWADPASLDLLRVIARGLADLPLLLLATYRADELTRRHPLYALLPLLVREARAARLDLRPLGEADLTALIGRYALPPADGDRLVTYLRDHAEGNPFYAGEVLRSLVETGVLQVAAAGGQLGDLAAVSVPPLLRQVIDARVDRLGDASRDLLAAAAVIGQVVPLELWRAVADADEATILATIERAVGARLLEPTAEGARFAHALVREALYEEILPLRRRAWHRRAAEALATTPGADPDAVAYHFRQAGDPRALDWLIRAGERARRTYAWEVAVERFERALALTDVNGASTGERGLLLYRLARLRRHADPRQALVALDDVSRIAAATGDRALAALVLFCRGMTRISLRETPQGLSELAAGVDALHALPVEEMAHLDHYEGRRTWPNAHGTLVQNLASVGRFAEAFAVATRGALDEPPASATGNAVGGSFLADMHHGLGQAHAALGRPEEAGWAFAHARAVYRDVEHHLLVGWVNVWEQLLVALTYYPEQVPERRQLAAAGEAALRRASGGVLAAGFPPQLAALPLLLVEGGWAAACSLGEATRVAPGLSGEFVAPLLGQLALAQGDAGLAWEQVRILLPGGPATEPTWQPFHCAQLAQRLAAALALDAGDLPTARSWLAAHDRWLAWSGAVLGRAEGQLVWAAYHRAAGDLAASRGAAAQSVTLATDPRQPLALLAARRFVGELDTTAGRHREAAAELAAALPLADACAAPYERALTLLALADLRAAEDHREGAEASLAEARALLEPLGARPALARADTLARHLATPATPPAPDLPFGLTAREAAVLRLVAEGLTDQQIGARLFVSRHTVNAHLRGVYGKLGVNTRAAAARRAADHGLA